jgi:Flp pilus assembly protein TadG
MTTRNTASSRANHSNKARAKRRGGFTLMYVGVCMFVLIGLVSFGIDLGRSQACKTELQRAVDASARYGATGLSDGTAVAKAITAGGDNTIDADNKQALTLTAADVTTGVWNNSTRTFTPNATPANAVKVSTSRSVPLLFASVVGKSTCLVRATAIGVKNITGPNFIGLTSVNARNNASMGYSSSQGTPGGANQNNTFAMGSNGAITFVQNASINGSVTLGPSGTYNQPTPVPLHSTTPLSYPATENPPFVSSGNLAVSGTTHVSGGGTKVYTNITFSNNATLIFDSPTTVYVTGNIDAAQATTIKPSSGVPKDLMIRMTGGPTNYFGGTSGNNLVITAMVYAPDVDFISKNNADLFGSMLFRKIDVQNNLNAYYDTDSGSVVANFATSTVALVR